ncbi:FAR1 DNA binding domain - like 3 [Theobroma cacao]|nr:FAR1 DNA binding domain - like 3 [Theobroma cacao]
MISEADSRPQIVHALAFLVGLQRNFQVSLTSSIFSMEIDLEVPSKEQEKLIPGSNETDDVRDAEDEIDVEDNDENPPTTSEHAEEACEPNLIESFTGCEDQVDVTTVEADVCEGTILEPQNGLEFESKEAAYSFYREYARSVGFGITIISSRRSKRSGKFIDVKVACSRFGSKRESSTILNPRSCPKTGCKARMHMKRRQDEKWIIHSFLKSFSLELYEVEAKADFETQNKQPELRSLSAFEKQMSMIYTDTIFKKFQVEILGVVSCHLQKESEDEDTVVFRVDDFEERQNFFVAWNKREFDICCLCRSFEYRGFLCKHAILVLQMSGVSDIPSRYILKRWTKEAKIRENLGEISNRLHFRVQRFNDLCKRAIKLGVQGCLSEEAYTIALQALEEALKHCVGVNNSAKSVFEPNILSVHGFLEIEAENRWNTTAKSSKKKKMYKRRKVHSELEEVATGQDNCQQMISLRAHTLDGCYVPQQDMQGMDVGSRAPTLDGYYSSQQNIQRMGQLNSMSPFRDGYYSNQQSMLGLGQLHSLPARVNQYGNQQGMQGLVLDLLMITASLFLVVFVGNNFIYDLEVISLGILLQGQLGFRAPAMQGFDIADSLQDEDRSMDSTHFHSIASKHLHDKHLS